MTDDDTKRPGDGGDDGEELPVTVVVGEDISPAAESPAVPAVSAETADRALDATVHTPASRRRRDFDAELKAAEEEADAFHERLSFSLEGFRDDQRLIALGLASDPEKPSLKPSSGTIFTLSLPRENLERARPVIRELAVVLDPHFAGDPDSGIVTLTCLSETPASASAVLSRLTRDGIDARSKVSPNKPYILRQPERGVVVVNSGRPASTPVAGGDVVSVSGWSTMQASDDTLALAQASELRIPREGECSFLVVDQEIFSEAQGTRRNRDRELVALVRAYMNNPQSCVFNCGGRLVIIHTGDTSASYLTARAGVLSGGFDPRTCHTQVLLGYGVIKHTPDGGFGIEGFPDAEAFEQLDGLPKAVRATDGLRRAFDRGGKQASMGVPGFQEEEGTRYSRVVSFGPEVMMPGERDEGPDRFFGYETQYAALKEALEDSDTTVIVVLGPAGIGKSRLIQEATKGSHSIRVAMLEGANKSGEGLLNMVDQLCTALRRREYLAVGSDAAARLLRFQAKSVREKESQIRTQPLEVLEWCESAIDALDTGTSSLIEEDMHFGDDRTHSGLQVLTNHRSAAGRKTVISARPEQSQHSSFIQDLLRRAEDPASGIKVIRLTEGLPFNADPDLVRRFAFHSLPPDFRGGDEMEQGYNLGDWPERLGRLAGTHPRWMVDLMRLVKRKGADGQYLYLRRNEETRTITLDEASLEAPLRDAIARGTDMSRCYVERIEALDPASRTLLHYAVLMGGELSRDQVAVLEGRLQAAGLAVSESGRSLDTLLSGYFLVPKIDASGQIEEGTYVLQHERMRDVVLSSMGDPRHRASLARELDSVFGKDPNVPVDAKFNWQGHIVSLPVESAPSRDDAFWLQYALNGRVCFGQARENRENDRAYAGADRVCQAPVIREAITHLQAGRKEVIDEVDLFAVDALFAKAHSCLYRGGFDEAASIIAVIESIHAQNPGAVANIREVYLLRFEVSYIQAHSGKSGESHREEMTRVYETRIAGSGLFSPEDLVIARMKRAYKLDDFNGVEREFSADLTDLTATEMPAPQNPEFAKWVEAQRLRLISAFERIRTSLRTWHIETVDDEGQPVQKVQRYDDDVLLHPDALAPDQQQELSRIGGELHRILTQGEFVLNQYGYATALEVYAQILAMLGQTDHAIGALANVHRLASQMKLPLMVVRADKMRGDLHTLKAVTAHGSNKIPYADRYVGSDSVDAAIAVRRRDAMPFLERLESDNVYQYIMRIQLVRDVGIRCMGRMNAIQAAVASGDQNRIAELRAELEPVIREGVAAYLYLHANWTTLAADPEVQYYLAFRGPVFMAARALGIEEQAGIPQDIREHLYSNLDHILGGVRFGTATIGMRQRSPTLITEQNSKLAAAEVLADYLGGQNARDSITAERWSSDGEKSPAEAEDDRPDPFADLDGKVVLEALSKPDKPKQ